MFVLLIPFTFVEVKHIDLTKISFIGLFLFAFSWNARGQAPLNYKAELIDSLLNACYTDGIFNGVALVADEGKIILHKSYGSSDFENEIPLQLNDRFYIGSVTKQFTSALILLLQEDERLNIHDPIWKYLPEFDDPIYQQITLHHLLTHTSGFDNFTAFSDFDKARNYTEHAFIEFIKRPLLFEPGSSWNYSNTNYYLLGIIAQRVTNQTYGQLLDERIFEPLHMNSSGFDTTWIQDNVAHGYYRTINGMSKMPEYSQTTLFSTGGIYSTAADLFKWDQALYTNQLLTDSSKVILFEPVKHDYACGWYVKKGMNEDGIAYERHFHGGWIKGYHAFILRRIPDQQTVILLDNSYSQELQTIKNRIWSALVEEEIRPIQQKLSNLLYDACAQNILATVMDSIQNDPAHYEQAYTFEEYDINTVAYRLMEAERFEEAAILFSFNLKRYPDSWNVYDSMGELQLTMGNYTAAKTYYEKSLVLNPKNTSAINALEAIEIHSKELIHE